MNNHSIGKICYFQAYFDRLEREKNVQKAWKRLGAIVWCSLFQNLGHCRRIHSYFFTRKLAKFQALVWTSRV